MATRRASRHAKAAPPPASSGVDDGKRLWPFVEARLHWQQYVRSAATYPQLSVAAAALRDHAAAFGLVAGMKKAEKADAARRCDKVWDRLPTAAM